MFKIKDCLVICPFGAPDSDERKRSDRVLRIIREATTAEGFEARRSIDIGGGRPGSIIENVIDKLCTADLIIADLTGSNANVYYELAVRLATGKPFIVLEEDPSHLEFDVQDVDAITIKYDFDGATEMVRQLRWLIQQIKTGDGRIDTYLSKKFLQ